MADPFTVEHVHDVLRQYARKRPDLGTGRALLDAALEPGSPFDSKAVRTPKRWFVLSSLLVFLVFVCFGYFNRL